MKVHQKALASILAAVLGLVLCGLPEYAQAAPQQAQTTNQQDQQNQQQGTTVNPAQGPLVPVPTENQPNTQNQPAANPDSSTQQLPETPTPQTKPQQQVQQPLGAATAEGVPTVGGAASRPAGEAIAPAKQNQRHSLLLKMGLIAAAAIATGTVVGLSKGTSGKPTQATTALATTK